MPKRDEILESIADKIADYREGEIPQPNAAHVNKWIKQFPDNVQRPMLLELDHIFDKTYLSKEAIESFLSGLIKNKKLCGENSRKFWKSANILDVQQGGSSQHDMREMFGTILQDELSLGLDSCGSKDGPYIYLDDGIFNGGRVLQDISSWIKKKPMDCDIKIIVAVLHAGGQYYVDKKLKLLQKELNITVKCVSWRVLELENRKYFRNESDVLWPTSTPDTPDMEEYARYITEENPTYELTVRGGKSVGKNKIFSSHKARELLEDQLLLAGLRIRSMCPNLPEPERPLGHTGLKTLGFGSTTVTYRNCPNNCPLAFWVGNPWYPLFPRKTNTDTAHERIIDEIIKIRRSKKK